MTILEGDWRPKRLVIVEFPSVEQAQAWWNSPEVRAGEGAAPGHVGWQPGDPGGRAAARVMLPETSSTTELLDVLARYWGYTAFRPLQREAMDAILGGRDSLVVTADRRREVALLSGARARSSGPRGRGLAAHLVDEGSGGHAGRQRRAGRAASTARCSRPTSARRCWPACARGATGCSTCRRNGWRGRGRTRSSQCWRVRTSASWPSTRRIASASGDTTSAPSIASSGGYARLLAGRQPPRLHRDGHGPRPPRHRLAARAPGSDRAGRVVRSAEPRVSGAGRAPT